VGDSSAVSNGSSLWVLTRIWYEPYFSAYSVDFQKEVENDEIEGGKGRVEEYDGMFMSREIRSNRLGNRPDKVVSGCAPYFRRERPGEGGRGLNQSDEPVKAGGGRLAVGIKSATGLHGRTWLADLLEGAVSEIGIFTPLEVASA